MNTLRVIGDYLCEQVGHCTCDTGLINPVHNRHCGWAQIAPMDQIRAVVDAHRRKVLEET